MHPFCPLRKTTETNKQTKKLANFIGFCFWKHASSASVIIFKQNKRKISVGITDDISYQVSSGFHPNFLAVDLFSAASNNKLERKNTSTARNSVNNSLLCSVIVMIRILTNATTIHTKSSKRIKTKQTKNDCKKKATIIIKSLDN